MPRKENAFFRVYTSEGVLTTLEAVMNEMSKAEVVFVGETHDDPVAHQLELFMYIHLASMVSPMGSKLSLSLEMFETDVQHQLDEYTQGSIQEKDLMRDARPWGNYVKDYKPMVEFSRDAGFRVLAANAPRRYVSAVGKQGREILQSFPASGVAAHLPPLPYPLPSEAYIQHFTSEMLPAQHDGDGSGASSESANPNQSEAQGQSAPGRGEGCPYIGFKSKDPGMLDPVVLWDATMAHRISEQLGLDHSSIVYHVCGSFHCQRRLGIVEMLEKHYRPESKAIVISVYPDENFQSFDEEEYAGKGDFIILTDANVRQKMQMAAAAAAPVRE